MQYTIAEFLEIVVSEFDPVTIAEHLIEVKKTFISHIYAILYYI